tara:strand:- start:137 stop:502 length:366 start_codon:yes stop_codon:yes gene_type:complete
MDIDKSLYMAEFLKIRKNLGTKQLNNIINTFNTNLYDEFKPKKDIEVVEEVVEELQEKTIHLLKKEDQPILFPELPELIVEEEKPEEVKKIQVSEIEGGSSNKLSNTKTISFDSNYIASDV